MTLLFLALTGILFLLAARRLGWSFLMVFWISSYSVTFFPSTTFFTR